MERGSSAALFFHPRPIDGESSTIFAIRRSRKKSNDGAAGTMAAPKVHFAVPTEG